MIRERATWVSGYRVMWMMVMFDLPVKEPDERRAATRFRNVLLDEGFTMAQYSVYYRYSGSREIAQSLEKRVSLEVPRNGSVHIVQITDKQYENMKTFTGKHGEAPKKPNQLTLF